MWARLERLLYGSGLNAHELARRLDVPLARLRRVPLDYRRFTVPKRSGGERLLVEPNAELKDIQRRINRRLLRRLRSHPAVHGFEEHRSIATNAAAHVGQALVIRLDLKDFFPSMRARWVRRYFRNIGWNRQAADLLVRVCFPRAAPHSAARRHFEDGLPQGAPTSPRLSNLVNYAMDARLHALAKSLGGVYTRYADDITVSLATADNVKKGLVVGGVERICRDCGYRVHRGKKRSYRRRHQRQVVTGIVVNDKTDLPREVRRRLRAVEHRLRTGKPATMTEQQLAGWRALERMVREPNRRRMPKCRRLR